MQVTGNNQNLNKSLSIRLCTDGFSFSVCSPQEEAGKRFTHIPYTIDPGVSMGANLKQALATLDVVRDTYHSVQVLIDGLCCYVPFESFEEDEKESVFFFSFPNERGKLVFYNILTRCNVVLLFGLDKSVYQLLTDYFPDVHLYAAETPVLEHLMEKSKVRDTQKLYAVFHPNKMSVFAINGGKLAFSNSFTAPDIHDYIYFLLQVWSALGMNQTQDEMHLIGEIPDKEQLVTELHRFVRQVYPVVTTVEFSRSVTADYPGLP
ncbi:MAG: DUF3822 family protein, partial [Bacteroidaceae bacterium]|nr:DUF3822 family protein [Bacteroidaceae bacterium]